MGEDLTRDLVNAARTPLSALDWALWVDISNAAWAGDFKETRRLWNVQDAIREDIESS